MKRRLAIGILVNSSLVPSWVARVVERIQEEGSAEVTLAISQSTQSSASHGPTKGSARLFRPLWSHALLRLDRQIFRVERDALEPTEFRSVLPGVPWITVHPLEHGATRTLEALELEQIAAAALDVIIRFGADSLDQTVATCARLGVWTYRFGDPATDEGMLPGFWDVLEGREETRCSLEVLRNGGGDRRVLYSSTCKTDPISLSRSLNTLYWKAVSFAPRILQQLQAAPGGALPSCLRQPFSDRLEVPAETVRRRGRLAVADTLLRHGLKALRRIVRSRLYRDQWVLLCQLDRDPLSPLSLPGCRKVIPPKDRFWADPFVIEHDHQWFVFVEECLCAEGKGHISCLTMDEFGQVSEPQVVLDQPYHLSYPFIFSHEDTYYMIPETAQHRAIELYRCLEFPAKWELAAVLLDRIDAADTTVLYHEGKWWLFTAVLETPAALHRDELFVFYSETFPNGRWTPHPLNPVVSDIKSARPGGRIFQHGGKLYRPSQDGSKGYGSGMRINLIQRLSPTEYQETCVQPIRPTWDRRIKGIHTLNFTGKITVADGIMPRSSWLVRHP